MSGTCKLSDTDSPHGTKLSGTLNAQAIFPNCPRYIPDLTGKTSSRYLPNSEGPDKKPAWKEMGKFRDALPANDPHN